MRLTSQIMAHLLSIVIAVVVSLAVTFYLDNGSRPKRVVVFDATAAILQFITQTDSALSDAEFQAKIAGFERAIPSLLTYLAASEGLYVLDKNSAVSGVEDISKLVVQLAASQ